MYPPKFDYYRAATVGEAIDLLRTHGDAKLLAGGHSLLPMMKLRLAYPDTLIDIGRIAELKGVARQNGSVRIGAMTPHAVLEKSTVVPAALSQAAGWIGDPMVRNRGTIGGSVAHADPAADLPIALLALDATFHIAGPTSPGMPGHAQGTTPIRTNGVKANDFFVDYFTTVLTEDQMLTAIEVPAETAGTGSAYAKLFNPASRFALVGAAASLTMQGNTCTAARVALGGLTPRAMRVPAVEAALTGRTLDDATIDAAAAVVADALGEDVFGDIHASAAYRRRVAPAFVAQAVKQAMARAG